MVSATDKACVWDMSHPTHCNKLQHTANALQHHNTPQHAATQCNTLQHTATHCNTVQHSATHCNTPQHTVTRCNTLWHTDIYEGEWDDGERHGHGMYGRPIVTENGEESLDIVHQGQVSVWMSYVTHTRTHTRTHIWQSPIAYVNESCHTHTHIRTHTHTHTHINTFDRVESHMCMSPLTLANDLNVCMYTYIRSSAARRWSWACNQTHCTTHNDTHHNTHCNTCCNTPDTTVVSWQDNGHMGWLRLVGALKV